MILPHVVQAQPVPLPLTTIICLDIEVRGLTLISMLRSRLTWGRTRDGIGAPSVRQHGSEDGGGKNTGGWSNGRHKVVRGASTYIAGLGLTTQ